MTHEPSYAPSMGQQVAETRAKSFAAGTLVDFIRFAGDLPLFRGRILSLRVKRGQKFREGFTVSRISH